MAFRGQRLAFKDWKGLNTFGDPENLDPNVWRNSDNVVLGPTQSAVVLRSPLVFTDAIANATLVQSAFQANYLTGGRQILFDIHSTNGGGTVETWRVGTGGGTPNVVRTGFGDFRRWKRILRSNSVQSLNGLEFIQITDSPYTVYANGITAPTATPTVSFIAGGSGTISSGVTVSLAYRNSTTGHVSAPGPVSASSGASGGNSTLRISKVASVQTGVDGIVVFITVDGGSIRYLLVDSAGNPQIFSNATGNIDISIANIFRDLLTPETVHNLTPPQNASFMFAWKDRIFLVRSDGGLQFSAWEACYAGAPHESWPEFNLLGLPNSNDTAKSGIATSLGALILGRQDSYLLSGYPSDKVSGPANALVVSEHIEPLNWGLGTRSPYSLVSTNFGEIWLDNFNRIMLWDHTGPPQEIGVPIRDLLTGLSTDQIATAEGLWYPYGELGGTYMLFTGEPDYSPSRATYMIHIFRDPESNKVVTACSRAALNSPCGAIATPDSGTVTAKVLVGGADGRLYSWFDPDVQGGGYSGGEQLFFECTIGSETEFAYFHSLKFDAPNITGLTLTAMRNDGTNSSTILLEQPTGDGSAWYGIIDRYAYRLRLKFAFTTVGDSARREIKNLRVMYRPTGRTI